jgi:malate dehydrogenase (oxaloacetate-decarboxylating)
MKITACKTLASLVDDNELTDQYILPDIFDSRVVDVIAETIYKKIKKG